MTKKRSARRMVIKRSEGGDSTSAAPTVDDERVVSEELETAQAEEIGVEEREEIEIGETPSGAQKETLGLVLGAEEMAEEVTDAPSGAEEGEIETVVPKEGVSDGFANGGFLEESEMDFQIGDMVVIGDITLLWHKGLVWRKFLDEALRMTTVVTPEYVNLIVNPWPQRSGSTIAKGDGMVPMAFEFYADRDLIAQDESGPVPFTVQAFPPISTPTAVGPRGRVFFNSSVRPATSGTESRPPVMYQPRIRPSVRTTPYPQQHPPTRASFASAAQQGQMNSNVGRTPEVICYRCRKIGHTQKFCRT
uniref:CCHC-type domain-containing protein n=1 Tax=Globodera pallida TaxID=36090 RepID=A0A183BLP5_GLOPA